MDIEQLKLVLDLLRDLGAESKTVIILWILLNKLPSIVICLCVIGAVVYIAKKILIYNDTMTKFQYIRDMLGVGTAGPVTLYEANLVVEKIANWRAERGQEKKDGPTGYEV